MKKWLGNLNFFTRMAYWLTKMPADDMYTPISLMIITIAKEIDFQKQRPLSIKSPFNLNTLHSWLEIFRCETHNSMPWKLHTMHNIISLDLLPVSILYMWVPSVNIALSMKTSLSQKTNISIVGGRILSHEEPNIFKGSLNIFG